MGDRRLLFGVLGPMRVTYGDVEVNVGGLRTRAVLAMLIARLGQAVSLDDLVAAGWDDPPPTARRQVRNRVSQLRDVFRQAQLPDDVIRSAGTGYVLSDGHGVCDSGLFEDGLDASAAESAAGHLARAREHLAAALALWRGNALEGLTTAPLAAVALSLNDKRLSARESLLDISLRLGEHEQAIPGLQQLVSDHPWRERAVSLLMTALYRAGRQREALEVFQRLSERLGTDLGIDPSPPLADLRNRILRQDESLAELPADPLAAPRAERAEPLSEGLSESAAGQAGHEVKTGAPSRVAWSPPTPLADFTGRRFELDEIISHVRTRLDTGTAPIVALHGLPGVGKTATAGVALHRLRNEFPAGQLYVDLHGHADARDPGGVLYRFLRQLGFTQYEVPDDIDDAAALYRSALAERPRLVLLDNAASAQQVRPLLPPAECPVVITSRPMLSDLDGALFLAVNPLPAEDAIGLLAQVVGREAVETQRGAAESVVGSCGRLPLALRIAAAQAVASRTTLNDLAAVLHDRSRVLDHLTTAERSVRASLRSSFESLGAQEQILLGDLALVTDDDFPGWVAAVVAGEGSVLGDARLARLVQTGFAEPAGVDPLGQRRFRLHDLVRQFGAEEAATRPAEQRRASLMRVAEGWHTLAEEAEKAMQHSGYFTAAPSTATRPAPTRDHLRDPGQWFAIEHAGILSMIRKAAAAGLHRQCWTLVWHSETYLIMDGRAPEFVGYAMLALDSAQTSADQLGVASGHLMLAATYSLLGEFGTALAHAAQSQAAAEQVADTWLIAEAMAVGGQIRGHLGDRAAQIDALTRSIPLSVQLGDNILAGERLVKLGELTLVTDREKGEEFVEEGIRLLRENPATVSLARGLRRLAKINSDDGLASKAIGLLDECLSLLSQVDDPNGLLCVHTDIAIILVDDGDLPKAARHAELAIGLLDRVPGPFYRAYAQLGLAIIRARAGDPQAEQLLRDVSQQLTTHPAWRARALLELGIVYQRTGRDRAAQILEEAIELAEQSGATGVVAMARQVLRGE